MTTSKIEWTDRVWNPARGCARVSPGCEHCYAERQAHRFSGEGQPYEGLTVLGKHGPRWTGEARFIPEMLGAPLKWRAPQRVFVNSMSDLFHADITNEQIAAVFGVMAACPQHTFQVLTKRPKRMREWFQRAGDDPHMDLAGAADKLIDPTPRVAQRLYGHFDEEMGETDLPWPLPNVWIGVSCEDQQHADERIPLLLDTPAAVRFVSAEPLLGPIDLRRYTKPTLVTRDGERLQHPDPRASSTGGAWQWGLDWCIVGGESGPGARPCEVGWIRSIVDQCSAARIPCFVKQLGANAFYAWPEDDDRKRAHLVNRKGGDPIEWPSGLRVREFPGVRP